MIQRLKSLLKPAYLIPALVLLIGVGFLFAEFEQIADAIQKADWQAIPGALLFTAISYFSMALSFALVCILFSIKMRLRACAEVGYVTNVINHILTAGGVVGFSLRIFLMGQKNVPARDVIAVSMMHYYLASLDMMIMLPVGLFYLMQNTNMPDGVMIFLGIGAVVFALLAIIASLIIFQPTLRKSVLSILASLSKLIIRKDMATTFAQFNRSMMRGIMVMRQRPIIVLQIITLTAVDWIASVMVLRFCLMAFGAEVSFGVVMTGFVIGIMVGLASLVPGGLGFQEGSMTWVLFLLGVQFGQAFLAAILFRAIFFFLPYLFSLLFYRHLLKPVREKEKPAQMKV